MTSNCFVTTEVPQFHERHLYPQRSELMLPLKQEELDKFWKESLNLPRSLGGLKKDLKG